MERVKLVSLIPPETYSQVMNEEAEALVREFADFERTDKERLPQEEIGALLADADACLTSWGVPGFAPETIEALPRLKIIGHAAGSVKKLVPLNAYERGIVVVNAAPVIAKSVGEMALGMAIAARRHFVRHHNAFALEGTRGDVALRPPGDLSMNFGLHHTRVGIIAASSTGRAFIRHLKAYGDEIEILVYDPFLTGEQADALGVRRCGLDELLRTCDVVSLHAPSNEATRGMIGRREVSLLKDGALLINTARGPLIDYDALYDELKTGRIYAALDVYLETLTGDQVSASPFRSLPNGLITPGIAGPSAEVMRTLGVHVVRDIHAYLTGGTPKYRVTKEMLSQIA